jgi:hypothetical protein
MATAGAVIVSSQVAAEAIAAAAAQRRRVDIQAAHGLAQVMPQRAVVVHRGQPGLHLLAPAHRTPQLRIAAAVAVVVVEDMTVAGGTNPQPLNQAAC